ncbi:MAG: hypothetical protein Q8Q10_01480 [bacterium]|nr:hypothetical protein [bacterium]
MENFNRKNDIGNIPWDEAVLLADDLKHDPKMIESVKRFFKRAQIPILEDDAREFQEITKWLIVALISSKKELL